MLAAVPLLVLLAGAEPSIDAPQQAAILARVLAYDRNLAERVGDAVVIGIVSKPDSVASAADGKRILEAFKALEGHPLKGKPFRAVALPWSAALSLADAKARLGVDAVYLAADLDAELPLLTTQARALKLTSLSGSEAYCASGVGVGLAIVEGKVRIIVNAGAVREEGAQFSSDLLRLAKVLK